MNPKAFTKGSGEGNGTPLQYSCLENPMGRGAWRTAAHGIPKSRTRLSDFIFTFHFSLSCIGEGNGNPLQCSCLENPMGRGAWWAAVYGFVQSRTRLKQLSSSSKSYLYCWTFILYWFSLMMLTGWILMYILFNLLWVVFLAHVPWS